MSLQLLYGVSGWLIVLGLFSLMLLASECGFWLGRRIRQSVDDTTKAQITNVQSAMLALFGLLLAFTFSMAVSRYDMRKQLVVEEANAIGTSYLRAQLLPEPYRADISGLLRRYVDVRLGFLEAGADQERLAQVSQETERIQADLWSQATAVGDLDSHSITGGLFLESLNEMIDLATKRLAALGNRIPEVVMFLLFGSAILVVGVVGYGYGLGARRNIFLIVTFCVLVALVILAIIDLDRPRRGLIAVSQQSMLDLRDSLDGFTVWDKHGFWHPDQSGKALPVPDFDSS